jgi:hypothetical protein
MAKSKKVNKNKNVGQVIKQPVKVSAPNLKAAPAKMSKPNNPAFGAVSTITTAPVAIGNSMRGMKTQVLHTADGCRVVGRDFAFSPNDSGTVTNWVLVGGIPLTPACLPSSVIRNVMNMYNRFKIRSITFHYITSSPTSTAGDVMFYVRRNEGSTMPGPTSSVFLPYILSDEFTVIGPQWTNHTLFVDTRTIPWLSTDYGATSELETYNRYDAFLYSKTGSGTDSPGYIIMDYDYEFREVAITPRVGQLSSFAGARARWSQIALSITINATAFSTVVVGSSVTTGIGGTTIGSFSSQGGLLYELVLDVTNSTFTNTNATNIFAETVASGTTAADATITDGNILYLVDNGSGFTFYWDKDSAYARNAPVLAGKTQNPYAETIRGFAKVVGNLYNSFAAFSQ